MHIEADALTFCLEINSASHSSIETTFAVPTHPSVYRITAVPAPVIGVMPVELEAEVHRT